MARLPIDHEGLFCYWAVESCFVFLVQRELDGYNQHRAEKTEESNTEYYRLGYRSRPAPRLCRVSKLKQE